MKLKFLSKIWWILFCVIIMNNTYLISACCWYWICNGQYLLDSLKTSTDWSILCQIHPTVSLTHKKISLTFKSLMELKLDCSVFHHLLSFFLLFFFTHFTPTPYICMYSVRTYFLLWNSKSQVIWIQDNQEQKFPIDGINKVYVA